MSYQIRQINGDSKSPSDRYTSISLSAADMVDNLIIEGDVSGLNKDKGIELHDRFLTSGNNYYLTFTLNKLDKRLGYVPDSGSEDYSNIDFNVYLISDGSTSGEYKLSENLGNFTLLSYEDDSDSKVMNFHVIFTPTDTYHAIGFIMKKTAYDYDAKSQIQPRTLSFVTNFNVQQGALTPTLGEIRNLLPNDVKLDKIGVQAKPGFFMCINGEPIRVGRTGIYEINNGYQVKFFGTPLETEPFILDYAFDSEG